MASGSSYAFGPALPPSHVVPPAPPAPTPEQPATTDDRDPRFLLSDLIRNGQEEGINAPGTAEERRNFLLQLLVGTLKKEDGQDPLP